MMWISVEVVFMDPIFVLELIKYMSHFRMFNLELKSKYATKKGVI
ncbi:hypothetical protein [Plasmodium yoelii yoelii]|uniref:Uncharacterized protein n=1 Tax=Plasmodium yoelii yoelii TaxID=73239 RepID=Q7RI69_PLAYO|nr:hypothetical protein [Plasmodium yoelii yoelii]